MAWTLTTLKTAIQDYTDNTESTFVTNLPTFITEAEDRIMDLVDLPDFRQNDTGRVSADNKYLALPEYFLAPFSLSVTSSNVVHYLIMIRFYYIWTSKTKLKITLGYHVI